MKKCRHWKEGKHMNNQSDEKQLHEMEQEWYAMQGFKTDIKCYFYYDESNNHRKFWVRSCENQLDKKFNVDPYLDFVLAGVVAKPRFEPSFEELVHLLKLQKNVKEIKFKTQFANGDFLGCMDKNRIGYLFQWINDQNLFIHYKHVNHLYYAIVEIIDSIMSPDEIEEMDFDYFSIKNTFYEMLQGKEKALQNIMFQYEFPNIKKDKIKDFTLELLNLFPMRREQSMEEKFITGMLGRASQSDELVFLEGNTDYVMQENYEEFYYDGPRKYYNAMHIYDEETKIQSGEKEARSVYKAVQLENMKYVNSETNVLVQVSDVVAGILGKLMIYINNKDNNAIRKDVENLTEQQLDNINMLRILREKSNKYNKGFLMSITATSVTNRMNFLFDLCKARAESNQKSSIPK